MSKIADIIFRKKREREKREEIERIRRSGIEIESTPEYADKLVFRIPDKSPQSADLIGDQRIHRVHNDSSDASVAPCFRRVSCFIG